MTADTRRVGAIVRKELITLTSYRVHLAMRFMQVWYYAISFYFVGEFVGDPEAISEFDGGYFEFVLIGSVVSSFVTVGLASFAAQIAEEQNQGTLESILTTPTPTWVLVASSHVIPLLFVAIETVVMLAIGLGFFGSGISVLGLIASIPILLLTAASFAPFGILSAAFIILVKRGDPFSGPVEQVTYLLSGAMFPITVLPGWLQGFAELIPATHGVRATRELAQRNANLLDVLPEFGVLLGFTLIATPIAAMGFRRAVLVARRAGTLGTY